VNAGFQCIREAAGSVREAAGSVREAAGSVREASRKRLRGVREAFGSGPIFMINISQSGIELVRHERGILPYGRRRGDEPHVTADPLLPIGLIRNFRDAKHPRTESGAPSSASI
jgi:hypothetical protein